MTRKSRINDEDDFYTPILPIDQISDSSESEELEVATEPTVDIFNELHLIFSNLKEHCREQGLPFLTNYYSFTDFCDFIQYYCY